MKKIVLSLSIIGAVAAMAIGATRAYFSDVETSQGNTFTAGTLDLKVNNENPLTSKFNISNIKPGDTGSIDINLENIGSIAGDVTFNVANIVDSGGVTNEAEKKVDANNAGDLSSKLLFTITDGTNTYTAKKLSDLATAQILKSLAASGVEAVTLSYELPGATTGNEVQGDSVSFDIVVSLNQSNS